jgi:hypothetical protein
MDDGRDESRGAQACANVIDSSSIEVFLHQAPLVADEHREPAASGTTAPKVPVSWRRAFSNFMFNKKPSDYSSIAPRDADGRRTKIFFFNGNGRGR